MEELLHSISVRLSVRHTLVLRQNELEMLARLKADQHDVRRRQADDDFGGWVKTTVILLAVSGPKYIEFRDDVGDPS